MITRLCATAVIAISFGVHASAAGQDAALEVSFVKQKLIGKTLETRSTITLANGSAESDYERRSAFSNLVQSDNGFQFDEVVQARQVIYDLSEDKKRVGQPRNVDRTYVVRWEFLLRKSTGKYTGLRRAIASSFSNPAGEAVFASIRLDDERLIIKTSTVGYSDFFGAGGKYDPGAHEGEATIYLDNGRLKRIEANVAYDVDPDTLARTKRENQSEPLVDNEIVDDK